MNDSFLSAIKDIGPDVIRQIKNPWQYIVLGVAGLILIKFNLKESYTYPCLMIAFGIGCFIPNILTKIKIYLNKTLSYLFKKKRVTSNLKKLNYTDIKTLISYLERSNGEIIVNENKYKYKCDKYGSFDPDGKYLEGIYG